MMSHGCGRCRSQVEVEEMMMIYDCVCRCSHVEQVNDDPWLWLLSFTGRGNDDVPWLWLLSFTGHLSVVVHMWNQC